MSASESGDQPVTPGPRAIPDVYLAALATRVRLSGTEWRVIALVLAKGPTSVRATARHLGLPYSPVKRAARALKAWGLLEVAPEGVRFRFEPASWGPPGTRKDPGP